MKATNDQLLKSYATTKSVWKTAAVFGMCGQSVHERLSKLGVIQKAEFTDEDKAAIERVYKSGFQTGDGRLDLLATSIGHHKTNICRIARAMGLTNKSRRLSESQSRHLQGTCSQSRQKNGHPKGMLGKSHTQKVKGIIGAHSKATWHGRTPQQNADIVMRSMKTTLRNGTRNTTSRANASWKAAWREVGDVRFYARSRWEANYARYLQFLKERGQILKWEHEPETFWFEKIMRGCRSYLPDFRVTMMDGSIEYHEVKGWMDARSVTKIKRMKKYHPKIKLLVFDGKWYRANSPILCGIVPDWEREK